MASSTYKGFKADDKLTDKSDYHAWKMPLDLALEDQDLMDYVQGNIQEPPSNEIVVTKMKYRKWEIKSMIIIQDSIHKHLVSYIYESKKSKEMYDKLVRMFRASNANQILFFKNQIGRAHV